MQILLMDAANMATRLFMSRAETWGLVLHPNTAWWDDLTTEPEPGSWLIELLGGPRVGGASGAGLA